MEKLTSGNIKFDNGRICTEDLKISAVISNKDKKKMIDNIEEGVRELAIKFSNKGYDLLSSCEGHSPEVCDGRNTRYLRLCAEKKDFNKLIRNLLDINSKINTTFTCKIEKYEHKQFGRLVSKSYEDPVSFYLVFGEYNTCQETYQIILDNFDKYTW